MDQQKDLGDIRKATEFIITRRVKDGWYFYTCDDREVGDEVADLFDKLGW